MINVKIKKGIIIGMIFLFVGSSIIPSINGNAGEPDRFVTSVVEYSGGGSTELVLGGPRGRGAYQGSCHVVSLGVSGSMTVAFDVVIVNGHGKDFIISENPFFILDENGIPTGTVFVELAYVEVSTDGVHFARFPSIFDITGNVGSYEGIDHRNVTNLAGVCSVYANVDNNNLDPFNIEESGGDAFDLDDLSNDPFVQSGDVDLQNINYVRLIDILGDGSCLDSQENPIYDPTGPGNNGADIDSISVINYRKKCALGWTTYQHDNTRNGVTNAVGAAYNWEKKLTYDISDRVLSPVTGDLDGDGHMDAVFSSDVVNPNMPIYAIDLKTGELKWSFMTDSAIWSTPTLNDLNDDGKLDVTFGSGNGDGHIYALYHNGTKMWDYFTGDSSNSIDGPSCVADVDGDGKPEVLVGGSCYYCSTCNTFFVLNGEDGSLLWGVNMGSTLTAPVIGEFDGDPGVEIVMGGYDGYVRVFDGEDGNEVWAIQPDASSWIESTPAIVDYGSDGVDDIAVFSGSDIYLLDGSDGNTIWSYPTAGSGLFGGISAGDIDEDGEPEIIVYPYYTGLVYAINLDGTLKWTRDIGSDWTYASPSPAIVDIDGDTHPEVIIQARSSGVLYALNGDTGKIENSFSLGTQSISSPAISDSDGDGIVDIIVGCDDGKLHVIGNPSILFTIDGCVFKSDGITPELDPLVDITNINTGEEWTATVEEGSNLYVLELIAGTNVNNGDTLMITSKKKLEGNLYDPEDYTYSLNVTNYDVTGTDINNCGVFDFDIILNHYCINYYPDYPYYIQDEWNYSGAAVMQMWTDFKLGFPYPQNILQTWGMANNTDADKTAGLLHIDPNGMATTLNGLVYPSHFSVSVMPGDEDGLNYALHRICWWQYLGPGALPTGGNYANWMSIRGIHTDKRPHDGQYGGYQGDWGYNVYGFWVNDPDDSPLSIGVNSYKTASEWTSTYYTTITDPYNSNWDGKYIAVLEPPEDDAKVTVIFSKPRLRKEITPIMEAKSVKIQNIEKTVIVETIKDKELLDVVKAAIDGVTEELIPYDTIFSSTFAKTISGKPLYINDDYDDYYIVPFNVPLQGINDEIKLISTKPVFIEDKTLIVVIVDAKDGHFKEASWVSDPVKYLHISKEDALDLVFAETKNALRLFTTPTIELVHRNTSPYYPDWKITFDNSRLIFFVDQNGIVEIEDVKKITENGLNNKNYNNNPKKFVEFVKLIEKPSSVLFEIMNKIMI